MTNETESQSAPMVFRLSVALADAAEKYLDNQAAGRPPLETGKAKRLREAIEAFRRQLPGPGEVDPSALATSELPLIVAKEAFQKATERLATAFRLRDRAASRVLQAGVEMTKLRNDEQNAIDEYAEATSVCGEAARALSRAEEAEDAHPAQGGAEP